MVSHSGWLLALRGGQRLMIKPAGIPKDWQRNTTGNNSQTFIWRAFFLSLDMLHWICCHSSYLSHLDLSQITGLQQSLCGQPCSSSSKVSHLCLERNPSIPGSFRFAGETCPHFCSAATLHPSDLAASSCPVSLARLWSDLCRLCGTQQTSRYSWISRVRLQCLLDASYPFQVVFWSCWGKDSQPMLLWVGERAGRLWSA